jgi:hypothetical protein
MYDAIIEEKIPIMNPIIKDSALTFLIETEDLFFEPLIKLPLSAT